MFVKSKTVEWVKKRVNYVETLVSEEEEGEDDRYYYDHNRVLSTISRLEPDGKPGRKGDRTEVQITPIDGAPYRTKVPWTIDSGVELTMLSEKHFGWVLGKNPDVEVRHSNVSFRP